MHAHGVESSLVIPGRPWGEREVQVCVICVAVGTGEVSFNDVKQLAGVYREERE